MAAGNLRQLMVIADDYGIGPNTSAGILDLAQRGLLTGSVLLVNSPYAAQDVTIWDKAGRPMELGWHPNLTLDAPVLSTERVPSLVNSQGRLWSLGTFMKKLFLGHINPAELTLELSAQLKRYVELIGHPPRLVNSHQHVGIFTPVCEILLGLLQPFRPRAYIRRVQEPWGMIRRIRGARLKRAFLNVLGRSMGRRQHALGFPGNDWLGGITDPRWVKNPLFFESWVRTIPGTLVEMSCHPGYSDETLLGRDCESKDGMMQRRIDEYKLLRRPEFAQAVAHAGFQMMAPSRFRESGVADAA